MTISALLLGRQFYALKPSPRFAYATLGLLFTNVSVGGVLTHYAAPPVLMVAGPWGWNTLFMFRHFGWIVLVGIAIANAGYYLVFRKELARLQPDPAARRRIPPDGEPRFHSGVGDGGAPVVHGGVGVVGPLPGLPHRRVPVLPGVL